MRAHDIRTFLMLPYNQERLEKMASGKKIGRPPGSGNKNSPAKRLEAADGNGTPMAGSGNGSNHCKDATPLARRPGRPKGSKNKISSSFLCAQLESTSENNM
jgi:hypothetical protein